MPLMHEYFYLLNTGLYLYHECTNIIVTANYTNATNARIFLLTKHRIVFIPRMHEYYSASNDTNTTNDTNARTKTNIYTHNKKKQKSRCDKRDFLKFNFVLFIIEPAALKYRHCQILKTLLFFLVDVIPKYPFQPSKISIQKLQ